MLKLLLFFQILFVALLSAEPANWVNWRGNNNDGISKETQWDISFSEKNINILWQKELGNGHSSVVIQDNYLYTMGNIKNKDIVYCLNTETGEEVWRYEYECEGGSFPGPRATPAVDGESIFTFSRNGHIFCLDAKTGLLKWKRNLIEEYEVTNLMHGISGSPCVIGDAVIFNAGASGFAFNKKTGEKLWGSDPKIECGYASPVPFQQDGVLVFSGHGLYLLEPLTGKQKFFFPWKTEYALNAADPVVVDNKIFICSYNDQGTNFIEVKNNQPTMLWQNEMKNAYTTPIILQGNLYTFSGCSDMKSKFHCLDLETGKEKWSEDFKYGSFIVADNKFIILDEVGTLFVINANPEKYEEVSKCNIFKAAKGMRAWTMPVLCNGKLYCRNSLGKLLCIQLQKK